MFVVTEDTPHLLRYVCERRTHVLWTCAGHHFLRIPSILSFTRVESMDTKKKSSVILPIVDYFGVCSSVGLENNDS